ncbi:hypothetical protein ACI65C_002536 [Semiaphis heraclei]
MSIEVKYEWNDIITKSRQSTPRPPARTDLYSLPSGGPAGTGHRDAETTHVVTSLPVTPSPPPPTGGRRPPRLHRLTAVPLPYRQTAWRLPVASCRPAIIVYSCVEYFLYYYYYYSIFTLGAHRNVVLIL